jgi:hypothetical protein
MDNKDNHSHTRGRAPVELRAVLHRLDRRDWWRWAAAIMIMLLTTAGVFVLSLPNLKRGFEEQHQLEIAVFGLLGLVLLFAVFAVHQQIEISRMRRHFAAEMAMASTDEVLRPHAVEVQELEKDERKIPRFSLDQRLSVRATIGGKETVAYGRTSDICEGGIGAVISEFLVPGTQVVLELNLDTHGEPLRLGAVVSHRRGFLHGFKFTDLTPSQSDEIRRACGDPSASTSPKGWSLTDKVNS